MVRGVFMDRSEAERNTLGDLFDRYLRDVSPSKKGASSESYRLRSLRRDAISEYKVAALTGKILAEWRDRRLKKVSGSTTNRDLGLINHVINVARKEWGVNVENPVSMIRRPLESKGRNRRLSGDEEQRLLKELEPSTRGDSGAYQPGGVRNLLVRSIVEWRLKRQCAVAKCCQCASCASMIRSRFATACDWRTSPQAGAAGLKRPL